MAARMAVHDVDHDSSIHIINVAYMGPVTLYTYLKYRRPTKPSPATPTSKSCHQNSSANGKTSNQAASQQHQYDPMSNITSSIQCTLLTILQPLDQSLRTITKATIAMFLPLIHTVKNLK